MPASPGSTPNPHGPPLVYLGTLYNAFIWGISTHPAAVAALSEFDPTPGDPTDDLQKMALDGEDDTTSRAKRILTVCVPGGLSQSRFVKDAPREEGMMDEGVWPRIVSVCGEERIIGQNEWDLYKMSDKYNCFVRREPYLSTITEVVSVPKSPVSDRAPQETSSSKRTAHYRPPPGVARRVWNEQKRIEKRRRAHLPDLNDFEYESSSDEEEGNDEADEDEVNDIIDVDVDMSPRPAPKQYMTSERMKMAREKKEEDREQRRERIRRKQKMQLEGEMTKGTGTAAPWADLDFNFARHQQRSKSMGPSTSHEDLKSSNNMKRKEPESPSPSEEDIPRKSKLYEKAGGGRRHRTMSPKAAQKATEALYKEHRQKRMDARQKRNESRKEAREREFMKTLYDEAKAKPGFFENTYRFEDRELSPDIEDAYMEEPLSSDDESIDDEPQEADEDVIRRSTLEESIRKIQELERDRPLWEAAARKRQTAEEAEERERQEAKRQKELAQQREREAEERRQREETARKAREEADRQNEARAAKADKERRRNQLRNNLLRKVDAIRSTQRGCWLPSNAIAWYRSQCDVFDKTKFRDAETVVAFESIPWPTLSIPGQFQPEEVTWESSEAFFIEARKRMEMKDYVTFVSKSAVRFHPDRWTAKGVLESLEKEDRDLAERFKAAAIRTAKIINSINSGSQSK